MPISQIHRMYLTNLKLKLMFFDETELEICEVTFFTGWITQ